MATMYRDSTLAGWTLCYIICKNVENFKKRDFHRKKIVKKNKELLGGLAIFSFCVWNLQNEIIILNRPVLKLPLCG
jgi:hypothetical protein